MKAVLQQDDFDNGRSPAQLQASFERSASVCIVYAGADIIGTARALSDGVCNAYVVDVWTLSAWRRQGIGLSRAGGIVCSDWSPPTGKGRRRGRTLRTIWFWGIRR